MRIISELLLLDDILLEYQDVLGCDYRAYRNHVYRTVNFCFLMARLDDKQKNTVVIAACFHDLGIWTEDTFDYLSPSISLAKSYLRRENLGLLADEIELMIAMHHKVRRYPGKRNPLVEIFRKADWLDVSLGLLRFGLSRADISTVKAAFPNSGFHRKLLQ